MPAASILPVSIHRGKLYFLFGKENPLEDSAKGFSDFGGKIESGETTLDAAVREGSEEFTGFLGSSKTLKRRLRQSGVYKLVHTFDDKNTYTVHLFPLPFDPHLVEYFNNNHSFLWSKMNHRLLNDSKLFEKIEVDWFCEDDLWKRKGEYRPFYADIVKQLIEKKESIREFVRRRRIPRAVSCRNRRSKKSNRATGKRKEGLW